MEQSVLTRPHLTLFQFRSNMQNCCRGHQVIYFIVPFTGRDGTGNIADILPIQSSDFMKTSAFIVFLQETLLFYNKRVIVHIDLLWQYSL